VTVSAQSSKAIAAKSVAKASAEIMMQQDKLAFRHRAKPFAVARWEIPDDASNIAAHPQADDPTLHAQCHLTS
jgi:hypothetical protein